MLVISGVIPIVWSALQSHGPKMPANQNPMSQRNTLLRESLLKTSWLIRWSCVSTSSHTFGIIQLSDYCQANWHACYFWEQSRQREFGW